ncbi:transposase [Halobacterium salinarum]|uniref:transposase n=1 Tax=Halobacterium salinarum TaxID=2242 RepID=UPI001F43AA43|nr:transposase [Halobacterium salinarum]MCF2165405.1 transposase [Halobacterium salinarum]MCF2168216.1 transposase [Halobacterium salinarum]MCF2237605.1 transposase [Halobacterium salinarum]
MTVAEGIIVHAETLCEREDHLWDVIKKLSIPVSELEDARDQNRVTYGTDEMFRALLFMGVRGISQNNLAARLGQSPALTKSFQFDITDLSNTPTQQDLSYTHGKFSEDTQEVLNRTVAGVRQAALDHGVITEGLVPTGPTELEEENSKSKNEYKKEKAQKTLTLARKHVLPEFDTHRAAHKTYSDEVILDMFARICANKGSAHSESEYGWLTDDDLICDDSTFLRAIKKIATPDDSDSQLIFEDDDSMLEIDRIRDSIMTAFDGATDNIINSIRGENPFSARETIAAIDITHEQFHVWPWEDKEAGVAKPDYPKMVSGYKKDGEYKRGYKYATITLVGDHAPIVLGIEPVKEDSEWEPDGSPSYSKADLVSRLLDSAERFVDLDTVVFDRGFYVNQVYADVHDRDLTYLSPVPTYEDDLAAIQDIQEHPTADAAVKHDVPLGIDGDVHHEAEFLYVPSTRDDVDGKYAVFVTNEDRVEPEEIGSVVNGYSRRWDIENQYKSIKDFLPKTSSTDYRLRLCNFALSTLIYNLWRLTDYLIKVGLDEPIRSPPVITAKTFVRALGDFLRKFG